MVHDVHEMVLLLFDEGELDEASANELSGALRTPAAQKAIAEDVRMDMALCTVLGPEADPSPSRQRLLAKAALRMKLRNGSTPSVLRRRLLVWTAAAVFAIVGVVGVGHWLAGHPRYPGAVAQGDFRTQSGTTGNGDEWVSLARGETVVAGPGGARLGLGGYCDLALAAGTEVTVQGQPGHEAVRLDSGRLVSRVTPGHGGYSVVTPTGELVVKGTEFVTSVEYRKGTAMKTRSVIVSVAVLSGVVGFDFGGEKGLLSGGMNRVFAGEPARATEASVRSQTKTGVVRRVDAEGKTIVVMVARELAFTVGKDAQILLDGKPATLADIKVGARVEVTYSFGADHARTASRVSARGAVEGEHKPVEAVKSQTKTGVVRRVDAEAKAIVVMVTRELTFAVTDGTEIRQGDAARTLADIHVGDTVTVVYSFTPERNRLASRVTIGARTRRENE
jgi:Cu/Ag efflux protein CusF